MGSTVPSEFSRIRRQQFRCTRSVLHVEGRLFSQFVVHETTSNDRLIFNTFLFRRLLPFSCTSGSGKNVSEFVRIRTLVRLRRVFLLFLSFTISLARWFLQDTLLISQAIFFSVVLSHIQLRLGYDDLALVSKPQFVNNVLYSCSLLYCSRFCTAQHSPYD